MKQNIIHIGAGEGKDIEHCLASHGGIKLILVEPNPDLAVKLRSKTEGLAGVEVYELAVVATAKEEKIRTLYEYNWNHASGLHKPDECQRLFPGLKVVKTHRVEVIVLAEFIKQLNMDERQEHRLVINAPAEERGIINVLCESGQIELFSSLTISWPPADLYSGGTDFDNILTRLTEYGFEQNESDESDESDPDWPIFRLQRNRWCYEQAKLAVEYQTQLDQVSTDRDKLKLLSEHRQSQVDKIAKERDEQRKLADDRQVQIGQLIKARNKQTQQAKRRQDEAAQVVKALDEQRKLADDRQVQIGQLTKARDEQRKLADDRQVQLGQLTEERNELKLLAEQRQDQIHQLKVSMDEMEHRQKLFVEEMIRVEGQIDLIKDVLLREPGI